MRWIIRMRYLALVFSYLLLLPAMPVLPVFGDEAPSEAEFIGAERCKLCHRSVYQAWTTTAHRRSTERLRPEERSPECLRCHATGPEALPGVQCEACHGAGGNFWPPEVMMDPEKAREAGLMEPDESACRACHGRGFPNHSSRFTMPSEADELRAIHSNFPQPLS